jgi:hypothetical protein
MPSGSRLLVRPVAGFPASGGYPVGAARGGPGFLASDYLSAAELADRRQFLTR